MQAGQQIDGCGFFFILCFTNGLRQTDGEIIELSETLRLFLMFSRCGFVPWNTEHTDKKKKKTGLVVSPPSQHGLFKLQVFFFLKLQLNY